MSLWKWWTPVAGMALAVGGVAWLSKLSVIVATDGRVVATGSADAFFDLGLYSLLVGFTGLGLRLTKNEAKPATRVAAAVVWFAIGVWLLVDATLRGGEPRPRVW